MSRDMDRSTYNYTSVPLYQFQQHQYPTQTVNPNSLTQKASYAPSYSDRPSDPITAAIYNRQTQNNTPTSSPYSNMGRQETWMGSVGFTDRFTRDSMGHGRAAPDAALAYAPEPLEPLFGMAQHLPRLPSPDIQQPSVRSSHRRGDKTWSRKQSHSGYIEVPRKVIHNGKENVVMKTIYYNRSYGGYWHSRP
ncbi:quinate permease [Fusarium pseudocircinatum]|uniref:Quinate permease n=1 Tax=Fusarium pseudocircinatum TaxID=56676 RepID=A0A8H5P679_9HYPO|nr:quinate permease [Fusarium pseudocircinatum]